MPPVLMVMTEELVELAPLDRQARQDEPAVLATLVHKV